MVSVVESLKVLYSLKMAKTVICCLKAVSEKMKKHRIIPLDDGKEVSRRISQTKI